MDKSIMDDVFLNCGLNVISAILNEYLGSNCPNDRHRELLEFLNEKFPEFREKGFVYRAIKEVNIPKALRNKFVSGCSSLEDLYAFINKRHDKGYRYILKSNNEIEFFNLYRFIYFFNKTYGQYITEFYQNEHEIVFLMSKGNDWYNVKKMIKR